MGGALGNGQRCQGLTSSAADRLVGWRSASLARQPDCLLTPADLPTLASPIPCSAHGEHGATAAYEYEPLQGGERMPTV